MTKKCKQCNSEFSYISSKKTFCSKQCCNKYYDQNGGAEKRKKWIKNNPEKRLATVRRYNETHRDQQKIRSKNWYQKNREDALSYQKLRKNRDDNSARTRAKVIMKNVPKICEECGSDKNIHIHHIDFNPLNNNRENLIKLCSLCHGLAHQVG